MRFWGLPVSAGMMLACTAAAQADVVISNGRTRDIDCSGGVCAPTSANAVLNAGDLETMLASGNVGVTTTGSGVQANNIDVKAPVSWSGANTLSLDAYESIAVARHVAVKGQGGLSLKTNDGGSGGTFSTGHKGRVSFGNLSSALTINDKAYTLVGNIQRLANDIATNRSGDFALADNYDASKDGTYSNTPVTTYLEGTVDGLGNTIENIHISTSHQYFNLGGLFLLADTGSVVANLSLAGLQIMMGRYFRGIAQNVGGLLVTNKGLLFNDHVGGSITVDAKNSGGDSTAGGLADDNYTGTISNSYSTASVEISDGDPGGLVSGNAPGIIVNSFATGAVRVTDGNAETTAGGFVSGSEAGTITNSYATGSVKGTGQAPIGGFDGSPGTNDMISSSYSLGKVAQDGGPVGGFIGQDYGGSFSNCYWDTSTSGAEQGTGEGNVTGITGLTTKQFKKHLPTGFDPSIWAEDPKINKGFPYLIANPPPEK